MIVGEKGEGGGLTGARGGSGQSGSRTGML